MRHPKHILVIVTLAASLAPFGVRADPPGDAPRMYFADDGQDYLFYQGNNTNGKTWYLSVVPIDWKDGRPVPAPERLPPRAGKSAME